MTIAFFSDGIQPFVIGGIQRHSFYFCKFLAQQNVKIHLYHTSNQVNPPDISKVFTKEELTNIIEFYIPFPKLGKLPGHYIRESYRYSELVYERFKENANVDFVYSKNYTSWKYLEEKCKRESLPPIGTMLHGYEVFQLKTKGIKPIINTYFHKKPTLYNTLKADYVFSYGGKISEIIENKIGVTKNKIIEIPTGIDEEWIIENIKNVCPKIKFCFLGRYAKRKGIHLIDRWLNENKHLTNFEFHLIGPIPNEKRIKSPNIIYHGATSDNIKIKSILRDSTVLVCPSRSEGMPNVIMEGMASGNAILATDVGAVSAMVSDRNGWLIDPENYTQFNTKMNQILSIETAESLLDKRNESIKIVRENYTWNAIATKFIKAINTIIT